MTKTNSCFDFEENSCNSDFCVHPQGKFATFQNLLQCPAFVHSCCQDLTFCCQNSAGWERYGSDASLNHKVGQAFAFALAVVHSSALQAQLLISNLIFVKNQMICELKFEIIMNFPFSSVYSFGFV